MVTKLSKKFITNYILSDIKFPHLGRRLKVPFWKILQLIIYRLKTGCQWRELPIKMYISNNIITWQTVYYHFNKWSKMGIWKKLWIKILEVHKQELDLSNISLDGSHTAVFNGGEEVGYQGRKKKKTTNLLFITDNSGIPLSMSKAISGNHNDLFKIENHVKKMLDDLNESKIATNGLFLNADAGFDSDNFRIFCYQNDIHANIDINKRNRKIADNESFVDEELYGNRYKIERTNAWIDSYKCLLVRYEKLALNWTSFHYLAFIIILLRKVYF